MKDLPDLQEKIKEPPFSNPYSIKARILIHAHLTRLTNLSPHLTKGIFFNFKSNSILKTLTINFVLFHFEKIK
jgi:hypothetical protein